VAGPGGAERRRPGDRYGARIFLDSGPLKTYQGAVTVVRSDKKKFFSERPVVAPPGKEEFAQGGGWSFPGTY
jgi:hypothetical protein